MRFLLSFAHFLHPLVLLSLTTMDSDHEAYILLLLSDSNLPTGAFVASAGLESYVAHGFFTDFASPSDAPPLDKMDHTISFLRDSLSTYAHSALPFVLDAHLIVEEALEESEASAEATADRAVERLRELDELYETMTLNHVARRASKSQGVALLTLFSKGFSKPRLFRQLQPAEPSRVSEREARATILVDRLKLLVRREETHGHLPICWGLLTAALELSSGANTARVLVHRVLLCIGSNFNSLRTESVPPSIPAGAECPLSFCAPQHHRTLRRPATPLACRSPACRGRDVTVQASHYGPSSY